ncbi:MAG: UvrD-helicase domain-containing protein [Acidobacteriaceae bacterium]|nr:UvrD-helicase domain-containing protein [Acidobacteriaceae bacterium]
MAELLQFPGTPAPAEPLPVADAEARAAALDPRNSFIVEAPAGSGKTGLMVQRILRLYLDPELNNPAELLAITFTRKATAELSERVLRELEQAQREPELAATAPAFQRETRQIARDVLHRSAQQGWQLLENPERLNIRSIDSVCAALANSVPVLSASGGDRSLLKDADALYRRAARRTTMRLGGENTTLNQALRTVLLHRDANLNNVVALIASMLAQREQWGKLVPLDPAELTDERLDNEVRPRLEKTLADIVCSGLQRALRLMPPGSLEALTRFAQRNSHHPGYKNAPSPLLPCAELHLAPNERAESLSHWHILMNLVLNKQGAWRTSLNKNYILVELPKSSTEELRQIIEEMQSDRLSEALHALRELPPAQYPNAQWVVAKALFHVLRYALAELKVLFAERSECDYAELSLAAREALEAEPTLADLALANGGRLRHLLVDEMQDTSAAQYELLEQLTRSWDGHTQTLFLVGDPKQSIYAFRQADVTRFLRTVQEGHLGDLPIKALQLTTNFRSQQDLVNAFNATFKRLFPLPGDEALETFAADVPFVAATAALPSSGTQSLVWHTTVLAEDESGHKPTAEEYRKTEASKVREIIAQSLSHSPEKTIAVLARNRKHLTDIATELRTHKIPYRAVEIEALNERQEVLDALALTRALLHPADRIAWLAVLRAPWCGLTLADLLALTGEGRAADRQATIASLIAERASLLTADGQALLTRCWATLAQALATRGRTSLATLVERTWISLGGDAGLSPDARQNAARYFELLRQTEADNQGRVDLPTLTTALSELYAQPASAPGTVEMLTIHKSKGLEWDLVLVPGLERQTSANRGELLNWMQLNANAGEDAGQVVLAPISRAGEEADALTRWLQVIRSERDWAERKRLFYVACTRAAGELHLFAALDTHKSGKLSAPPASSLLQAIYPAAEPYFALPSPWPTQLLDSRTEAPAEPLTTLSLAASEDAAPQPEPEGKHLVLQRIPLDVHPAERFDRVAAERLAYVSVASTPLFRRPEGSFAARAFGNVVHRYLQLLSDRMAAGSEASTLLHELESWNTRLLTSLRSEGLSPALATRESQRALGALRQTLLDETGSWILSPHSSASSESALATPKSSLRADRVFLAGSSPLLPGQDTLWIVDFKTSEQGTATEERFAQQELQKYQAQLESYAALHSLLPATPANIRVGLYYPLLPRLISWTPMT